MQQPPAADGDRSCALQQQQGTALSLKARETASLSLKRIFEQHLQNNSMNDHSHHHRSSVDLDLRLGAAAPPPTPANYTSINRSGNAETSNTSTSCKVAQLTVFYAGTVCVFEDVPADKAKAILLLAAGSAGDQSTSRAYSSCVNAACKSRPTTPDIISSKPLKPRARSQAELPFARKASLTRFLERRKGRVETKALETDIKNEKDGGGEISTEPPHKRLCTKPSFASTNL